ncbi:PREDICTED: putative F-box protein At1g30945 [Camelina sativa]|uniref:F-box protein At1g30945 n=1 Tax=Camelina sativa TaxID=90675 RepID=A0ABM0YJ14_CAMSA|nr:PREDICTED: putative F-box protein At1g30945 [Camelina sativa]
MVEINLRLNTQSCVTLVQFCKKDVPNTETTTASEAAIVYLIHWFNVGIKRICVKVVSRWSLKEIMVMEDFLKATSAKLETALNQDYLSKYEKFEFIKSEYFDQLINYKGKLGGTKLEYETGSRWRTRDNYSAWRTRELRMSVLEDIEKQEWSICVFPFPDDRFCNHFSVVGVTTTGEIVLWETFSKSYVIYFSPVRNTFQYVNFQGRGANCASVYAIVDHIEDVSVNDAKQLKSSI